MATDLETLITDIYNAVLIPSKPAFDKGVKFTDSAKALTTAMSTAFAEAIQRYVGYLSTLIRNKSFTLTLLNDFVKIKAETSSITVSLPKITASIRGKLFHLKRVDGNPYTVKIKAYGSDLIDGQSEKEMSQWTGVSIIADEEDWSII